MKQTNKIFLLVVLMCLTNVSVMANKFSFDFEVGGIRYAKINNTKVKVVTKKQDGFGAIFALQYKGDIVIPRIVTYNGISYTVTTIGEDAFHGADLTSISLPESITTIEAGAFQGCVLTSITLPESVTTIGRMAFIYSFIQTFNIPEGVTTLEPQTFSHCTSLLSIHIPDGVKTIDRYCFERCRSLKTVTGLKGVTSIGMGAFLDCENLPEISIPSKLETLGEAAFKNCTSLSSPIVLPSTLQRIETEAFYGCANIPSVTMEEGVQHLGNNVFGYCSSLTSIYIPASLTSFHLVPFSYCTNLTSIKVAEDNPMFDSRDNCNAIMSSTYNNLVVGCNGTVIPSTAEGIAYNSGWGAFVGCHLPSVRIPAGMTDISTSGFQRCYIGEISVEEGNEVYDSRNNCNAIIDSKTNVLYFASSKTFIPEDVVAIQGDFRPYTEMNVLYSYADTPPTLSSAEYKFTIEQFQKIVVYIPKGSKAKYESAEGWDNFWNFKEFDPTGIDNINTKNKCDNIYYDLNGVRLDVPKHGLNIIKAGDGTTKKVMVK